MHKAGQYYGGTSVSNIKPKHWHLMAAGTVGNGISYPLRGETSFKIKTTAHNFTMAEPEGRFTGAILPSSYYLHFSGLQGGTANREVVFIPPGGVADIWPPIPNYVSGVQAYVSVNIDENTPDDTEFELFGR